MTDPATAQASDRAEDLSWIETVLRVFTILFDKLYTHAPRRYIERSPHTRACSFLRGVEAMLRRVLMIRAAALARGLPSAQERGPQGAEASRAKPASPAFDPANSAIWRLSFSVLKRERLRPEHVRDLEGVLDKLDQAARDALRALAPDTRRPAPPCKPSPGDHAIPGCGRMSG